MEKTSTTGGRIAFLREKRKWTQKRLAQEASISVTFLSEIENDKRTMGSEVLLNIADALGASLDYIIKGEASGGQSPPQVPISVPPELNQAAESEGWSYPRTKVLLDAKRSVLARRSKEGQIVSSADEWTKQQWVELYKRLFDDE